VQSRLSTTSVSSESVSEYLQGTADSLHRLIDSWKGYSALGSIIKSPLTQLRRLTLQILILRGADACSRDITELGMKERDSDALDMLMIWEKAGKEKGISIHALTLICTS